MILHRSKAEHVAEYLRGRMREGGLVEPLPTLRDWSAELDVSMDTLQAALSILKREGWISSLPRKGYALVPGAFRRQRGTQAPVMRWVSYGPTPVVVEHLDALSRVLSSHRIALHLETFTDARLDAILKRGARPHEVLALPSYLPRKILQRFSRFFSVLVIGTPPPEFHLPYVTNDVFGAIRHAVFTFCRQGFEQVSLLNFKGIQRIREPFCALESRFGGICAAAPRAIRGQVIGLPYEVSAQREAIRRLASRLRGRHAFVVNGPISPGLLIMALLSCGITVGEQVQVVAVNISPQQTMTFPPIAYYPFPLERFARSVARAANHLFEQGSLPHLKTLIPMERVEPS